MHKVKDIIVMFFFILHFTVHLFFGIHLNLVLRIDIKKTDEIAETSYFTSPIAIPDKTSDNITCDFC